MMFVLKSTLGVAMGAGLGSAIGYSQLLCPDGGCPLTGSWYGGAMFGAIMGLALTGAIGGNAAPGAPVSAYPQDGSSASESKSDSAVKD